LAGAAMVVVGLGVCGCEALLGLLQSNVTTVRLVNNGQFTVHAELFISSEQDIPESLLTADNDDREEYAIPAGETVSFFRDCDDLQAIIIDEADLNLVGEAGPETSTGVLRDGDDFGCGDIITFTFDHSEILIDFDVSVSVQGQ
jgi:hypothetical protein